MRPARGRRRLGLVVQFRGCHRLTGKLRERPGTGSADRSIPATPACTGSAASDCSAGRQLPPREWGQRLRLGLPSRPAGCASPSSAGRAAGASGRTPRTRRGSPSACRRSSPQPVVRVPVFLRDARELVQASERGHLVADAELVLVVEADMSSAGRDCCGSATPLGQHRDAAGDVEVHVVQPVHLDRHVVGQVPALEEPRRDEVRLELGDRVDRDVQLVPLVLLLLVDGVQPQGGDGQAARCRSSRSCTAAPPSSLSPCWSSVSSCTLGPAVQGEGQRGRSY